MQIDNNLKNIRRLITIKNCLILVTGWALGYCIIPTKGFAWFICVGVLFAATLEFVAMATRASTKKAIEDEISSRD